jgi:ribosome-associated protein
MDEPERSTSRSQRKREAEELQKLGGRLADLPPEALRRAPIPGPLHEALEQLRAARHREARRRQLQYIGRLMRDLDAGPIRQWLADRDHGRDRLAAREQQIERWRDRLVAGDDGAMEEILARWPGTDRERLTRLVREARGAQGAGRKQVARVLLRWIRGLGSESQHDGDA